MPVMIDAEYTGKENGPFQKGRKYQLRIDEQSGAVSISATSLNARETQAHVGVLENEAEDSKRNPKRYSSLAEFFGDWTSIQVLKFI